MTITVSIITNPFDPSTRSDYQTDDLLGLLRLKFEKWPETARIYHEFVADNCEVTPRDEAGVERLKTLPGPFYVVVLPAAPVVPILINLAIAAVLSGISYLLSPKPGIPDQAPIATQRNIAASSPNNELSERTNSARLHGRIPDIFGTVRSTPDLIGVPYSIFVDHLEVEIAIMCIGRGEYEVSEPRDGDTLISDIEKASVEVYAPFTSPNSGDAPQFTVGDAIDTPVANIARLTAVNGQDLLAPNATAIIGANDIRFFKSGAVFGFETNNANLILSDYYTVGELIDIGAAAYSNSAIRSLSLTADFALAGSSGIITLGGGGGIDLDVRFPVGALLTISASTVSDGSTTLNLDGVYTILAVSSTTITLLNAASVNAAWNSLSGLGTITTSNGTYTVPLVSLDLTGSSYEVAGITSNVAVLTNPAAINSDWNLLTGLSYTRTEFFSPVMTPHTEGWVGPFVLSDPNLTAIIFNFVALNGLYRDDGTNQTSNTLSLEVEITPLDADGLAAGASTTNTYNILGSSVSRTTRALTAAIDGLAPSPGGYRIRARRSTGYDYAFSGTTVDSVKWRDCYSSAPFAPADFGNVTTVQSRTFATSGALAVKQRKLSMLVTRKVPAPLVVDGSVTGFGALAASNDAADILCAVALDPYIGRRTEDELEIDSIYDTLDDIEEYFGDAQFRQFNYTFDKSGLSFEETAAIIAAAINCTAYRRGSKLNISFEAETEDSGLLFNHRNKIPKSEIRTIRWGLPKDYDGIELTYVSPEDDAIVSIYIPEDRSAKQPQKIESVGIRSEKQAYVAAWRARNKQLYQNITTQFDALQEADLLVVQDRILVADNTRSGTLDGEVVSQDVLTLKLSQTAHLDPALDYTIFLQHTDGTVESMPVTPGSDDRHVILDRAPATPLSLDVSNAVRAGYIIVMDDAARSSAFLMTERKPKDNFTSTVTAINYDARYYQNDLTFPA